MAIVSLVTARFISVYLFQYAFIICCKNKTRLLSFKEVTFISYTGLIKGAICYGLGIEVVHMSYEKEVVVGGVTET